MLYRPSDDRRGGPDISANNKRPGREAPSILAKAFDLLRAFNASTRVMTLTELARSVDLPKSTVHRLLARLVELDVVEHVDEGYRVSVSLARLASFTPANLMRDMSLPYLARLHQWSGQTVVLGLLRGMDVVILDQVGSLAWYPGPLGPGNRMPASSAAIGKVLLAWDPRETLETALPNPLPAVGPASITDRDALLAQLRHVRAENLASQLNETRHGVAGIASAIVIQGEAVGSIGIVYPSSTELPSPGAHVVRTTAARLGREIGDRLAAAGQDRRWMPGRKVAGLSDPDEID